MIPVRIWLVFSFVLNAFHLQTQTYLFFYNGTECGGNSPTSHFSNTTIVDFVGDCLAVSFGAILAFIVLFFPQTNYEDFESSFSVEPLKRKQTIQTPSSSPNIISNNNNNNNNDEKGEQLISEKSPLNIQSGESEEENINKNYNKNTNNNYFSAESDSNIFKKFLFMWVTPLLDLGSKKPLEMEDLLNPPSDLKAENAFPIFEKHWKKELEKEVQNRSILRAIFKSFGWQWALAGVFQLFETAFLFAGPFFLDRILDYIQDPTNSANTLFFSTANLTSNEILLIGLAYVVLLFLSSMLQSICNQLFTHIMAKIGFKVKVCLMIAIYRKTLDMNFEARKKTTTGTMMNLLTSDSATPVVAIELVMKRRNFEMFMKILFPFLFF